MGGESQDAGATGDFGGADDGELNESGGNKSSSKENDDEAEPKPKPKPAAAAETKKKEPKAKKVGQI